MLRASLAIRRAVGVVAFAVLGGLSLLGWAGPALARLRPKSGAEVGRLYMRSLLASRRGRFVDRSGVDWLTLWLFGLPVYIARAKGAVDVQLPSGLVVRGHVMRHGSVDLFTPVLPEFRMTPLVLVPRRRRS